MAFAFRLDVFLKNRFIVAQNRVKQQGADKDKKPTLYSLCGWIRWGSMRDEKFQNGIAKQYPQGPKEDIDESSAQGSRGLPFYQGGSPDNAVIG